MRYFIGILLTLVMLHSVVGQNLFSAQQGSITFFSKAPMEDIEAKNNKAQSMINTATGEIAVKVPIKNFVFDNGLMQEHFNENYLESDKYPWATFKGKINEKVDWGTPGVYPVSATGTINIHGVERSQTLTGKLNISGSQLELAANFTVVLVDHNIKVPSVVFTNIAEKIAVSTQFIYLPYVKR